MPPLYRSPLALPFPLTLQKQLGCWAPSPAVSACEPVQPAATPATLLQPLFHPRSKPSVLPGPDPGTLPSLCTASQPTKVRQLPRPCLPAFNRGSPLRLQPQATVLDLCSQLSAILDFRVTWCLLESDRPLWQNLEELHTLSTNYSPHKEAYTHTHMLGTCMCIACKHMPHMHICIPVLI